MHSPVRYRQIGLGLVMSGALLAGLSSGLRANSGNGQANWMYLLDVVAVLLAVAGGIYEARTADIFFNFAPRDARRRAMLSLLGGLFVALVSCVLLSLADQPLVRGIVAGVLLFGVGIGAGGLFSLAWYYGGRYAADRIQERSEDDW